MTEATFNTKIATTHNGSYFFALPNISSLYTSPISNRRNFMKYLATIQSHFLKLAYTSSWDSLSLEQQKDYLTKHPKSKRHITAKPTQLSNLKQQLESKQNSLDITSTPTNKDVDKLQSQIDTWLTNSQTIATSALTNLNKPNIQVLTIQSNNTLNSIAAIDTDPSKPYIKIKDIASNTKGYGTKLMKQIAQIALKHNKPIALVSMTTDASKFYSHLGLTQDPNNSSIFHWPIDSMKKL